MSETTPTPGLAGRTLRLLGRLGPSGGTLVIGAAFLVAISLLNDQTGARTVLEQDPSEVPELAGPIPLEQEPPVPESVPATPEDPPEPPTLTSEAPRIEWQRHTIGRRETLGSILPQITDDEEAIRFLTTKKMESYRRMRPKTDIEYKVDDDGRLVALRYKTSPEYYLMFTRANGTMAVTEEPPELTVTTVHRKATIEKGGSVYPALSDVGTDDGAIAALITALETHIDFFRDIHPGDQFELIYDESHDAEGERLGADRPKAFVALYRGRGIVGVFDPEIGGYYTPEGVSVQRAFLRAPLKFTRISSKFSLRRLHPVLKVWRPHRGVDYAAPRGTPVRSTGDGVVSFVGRKGGYGKVVFIKHHKIYETVYGHLSAFRKGVRKGKRVAQGDVIGYVGATGLATGPHLHYEFRVRGKHRDPLSAEVPVQLPPLEGADLERFRAHAEPLLARLELYQQEEIALQE